MYLMILDQHGHVEHLRELDDNDLMDIDEHASEYAESVGLTIDTSGGYIPNCCGDFRIEYRNDPENSVSIYSGKSYYFKGE